jgi:hypothetical protein
VRRVVKPGGTFALFDIMRTGDGELSYPVPWSTTRETSFVAGVDEYRQGLEAAGFMIAKERNRRDYAVRFFTEAAARVAAAGGPPPLGTHILMRDDAPRKIANTVTGIESGVIAPVELVCRAG